MAGAGVRAIRARDVSKDFRLPHVRHTTLRGALFNALSLSRAYDLQHALRDVTFDVQPGEFFGVVGRNGSGKSTLLKILAGIYPATSGSVETRGKLVPFIELGVGFNSELSGRDNVYLNGALMGFSKREMDTMYPDIVDFAELEPFMAQKLKNYSSGMQVRLAFSVATRAKADILLIDEVLAVGDAAFQRKCYDYFRHLKKEGTTIVFVSHDMGAVRQFCDRAILIEETRILAEGSADQITAAYSDLFTAETEPWAGEGSRHGEGGLRYVSAKTPLTVAKQPMVTITLEAVAEQPVEDPAFGFAVKNGSGTALFGTNSALKRQHIGRMNPGQRIRLTWTIPNIFSDGQHYLDFSIHDRPGLVMYDYWQEARTFFVKKDDNTPYIVHPQTDLAWELE